MGGVAVLAAVAVAWALLRPPRRELVVAGLGLALALTALTVGRRTADGPDLSDPDWRAAARRAYTAAWTALDDEAARAGTALAHRGLDRDVTRDEARLAAFRTLSALLEDRAPGAGRWALLLVDPDGAPVAWAGEGLLHELVAEEIPRAGRSFEASFGAVTLVAAQPLDDARRPWRAVAARSFSTDHLPFAPGAPWLTGKGPRWSLVERPAEAAPGATLIALPEAPYLVVEESRDAGVPGGQMERLTWALLGLSLLLLAAMRGTGLALGSGAAASEPPLPGLPPVGVVTALAATGAVSLGLAVRAGPGSLASLVAGLGLAVAGMTLGGRLERPAGRAGRAGRWLAGAAGAAVVLVLTGVALLAQSLAGVLELSDRLFADPDLFLLRLALVAAAIGLLAVAGASARWPRGTPPAELERRGEGWAWLAAPLLLAGAAACDHTAPALALLSLGGAAVALWVGERRPRHPAALAVLVLLASLLTAGVWETAHRRLLRVELVSGDLAFGDADDVLAAELEADVEGFFTGADLTRFVPRSPDDLERDDLAFLLWQESPLARPNALSSLTVTPYDRRASGFSFGVPADGADLTRRESWPEPPPVPVAGRLLSGDATLLYGGEPWAEVRWNLLPLPGFRLHPEASLERVEAALLRGLPRGTAVAGMPEPVVYVHYGFAAEGGPRPLVSPWQEEPPLDPALAGEEPRVAVVGTPAGEAWAVSRPDAAGWEVLYLPLLSPRQALERAGSHALGVLTVVLALALLALLAALPRVAFRDLLRRTVRSYSKRLLLVYTLLLLVPLLLLNAVLVAAVQDRLRQEQRAAGEAALSSAQQVMADYLASLDPGFDLASAFDDDLLRWLSSVLHHEINLYWGSEIWASSKQELFTARLLPKRIPGESFAGIAFLGHDLAARTNRLGDVSYLELYAPLTVLGAEAVPSNIFLSMPLLAQQEEVARELATLRRQGLLVTAALIVLVSAVGVRLSRSFTRPLTELVEGTRRIAAGATSLDMAPSELELAALVEAVDDMARRIAEGRERLMREKQVVERMVEHVTSGVVSLDRDHRVLMRNRVAAELLGVEVGERLAEALKGNERLAPVASWLGSVGRRTAQRTVRLTSPEEPDAEADAGGGDGETEGGGEREWTLVWVPVPGAGEPAALLVVEDVTETLRSQRLEAWAEMARIIAHEIKNPLTPIRLNIEHVQQVWSDRGADGFGAVLERCADNVLTQVDELRQIAGEFSTYSRIPRIEPRPGDLVEAMEELAEPYLAAPPAGVEVELVVERGPLPARFDRRLLSRAVRNLVENALRASAGGGRVVLRLERRAEGPGEGERPTARISVLDAGPGIDAALLPRIFDPYFSTYDTGTGLGLPIARRIAEEHGGSIGARNRPEGGLEVWISVPLTVSR